MTQFSFQRRYFLSLTAATTLTSLLPHRAKADEPFFTPLYKHPPKGGPDSPLLTSARGNLSHISVPGLHIIKPNNPTGAAMIIAGGGGYHDINFRREALPTALWLANLGITAAILLYRLPQENWHNGPYAPLADAKAAYRLLHKGHIVHIDPDRIGLMGYSAGGHLIGLTGLQNIPQHPPQMQGPKEQDSLFTPALIMLAYPVVSLMPPYTQNAAYKNLLGISASTQMEKAWSVQTYVSDQSPPLFLVNAADDAIVPARSMTLLSDAYHNHKRDITHHLFPSGGHGFALGRKDGPTKGWPKLAEKWMKEKRFI